MGQLAEAKSRLSQATADEEQNRVKLGMAKKDLKALEGRWKEVEKEAGDGRKRLGEKEAEVERLRREVMKGRMEGEEGNGEGEEKEGESEEE